MPDDTPPGNVNIQESTLAVGQGDFVGRDKVINFQLSREYVRVRRDQLILLKKEIQPNAVQRERPWDITLEVGEQEAITPEPVPPGKKLVEIFDELEHALLILGAPGSGKTITLLELARDLIARAEDDPNQPVPVVFNLSSWAERRLPLAEWLADELSVKYQIPRKIGRKWIADNDILPLLDGLDEVRAENRSECVGAINAYYKEHGLAGIAVCSRTEEYGLLKAKLALAGAILIQPLAEEQITDYPASFGTKLAGLYKALKLDTVLKEMAHSPLMLGVMSLAYADVSFEDVLRGELDSVEARRKRLFDTYVTRMFKRKGIAKGYTPEQTVKWLSWLARGMEMHKQGVFLIEGLQPSWLGLRKRRWLYVLASRLTGGLAIGISLGFLGLIGGFGFLGYIDQYTSVVEILPALLLVLVWGLLTAILFFSQTMSTAFGIGLIDAVRYEKEKDDFMIKTRTRQSTLTHIFYAWLTSVLMTGTTLGLIFGAVGLIGGIVWVLYNPFSAQFNVLFRVALPPLLGILLGITGAAQGLINGVIFGLIFGLIFGVRRSRQNLTNDIQTVESLGWSWRRALKGTVLGSLIGALFGVISGPIESFVEFVFNQGEITITTVLYYTLKNILQWGLAGAILGLLFGAFVNKIIELKPIPNQGMRLSVRNAIIAGLGFVLAIGFSAWLIWGIASGRISTIVSTVIPSAVFFGSMAALWYGGLDVIYHYTLRLILSFTQPCLPLNLARFLDHCAERVFLQKVGGGYIFIHRLLLEYFAEREPLSR
jgi:hypothetical protein